MTTVKITIDDSLRFSDLKPALPLVRGISKKTVAEYHNDTDNIEYGQLRNAFFCGSRRSMSQHISKFLE